MSGESAAHSQMVRWIDPDAADGLIGHPLAAVSAPTDETAGERQRATLSDPR